MNQKRKILYIAHERKMGGASLALVELVTEMQKRSYDIYAIAPTHNCPVALQLKELNVHVISIFMPWWQMPSYWNPLTKLCFRIFYGLEFLEVAYALFRLRNVHIDIVHTNASVADLGARIARHKGCKHVWHVREFGDVGLRLEYLRGREWTWKYMNEHSDRIVFISNSTLQHFETVAALDKRVVIYDGIRKEYLIERNYAISNCVTFISSGNLNENKQQLVLLQAGNELLSRGVHDFIILLAGTSTSMTESQQYERQLRAYIESNLLGHAELLGQIVNMNEVRSHADVEVVASVNEAFGRVTIEGMFAGMPVIVSDSGANTELVQDGVQGFIFHQGDYIDLADQMEKFINDRKLLKVMGKRANEYAKDKYTATRNAQEIDNLYHSLMS